MALCGGGGWRRLVREVAVETGGCFGGGVSTGAAAMVGLSGSSSFDSCFNSSLGSR